MNIENQGKTTIITSSEQIISKLIEELIAVNDLIKDSNLIIDLSSNTTITNKDINQFSKISNSFKKFKKSFILVLSNDFDFNSASDKINIVPSIQEAHDTIEMEEIERDLGF